MKYRVKLKAALKIRGMMYRQNDVVVVDQPTYCKLYASRSIDLLGKVNTRDDMMKQMGFAPKHKMVTGAPATKQRKKPGRKPKVKK